MSRTKTQRGATSSLLSTATTRQRQKDMFRSVLLLILVIVCSWMMIQQSSHGCSNNTMFVVATSSRGIPSISVVAALSSSGLTRRTGRKSSHDSIVMNRRISSEFPHFASSSKTDRNVDDGQFDEEELDQQEPKGSQLEDDVSLESFQKVAKQQQQQKELKEKQAVFDGYALRDVIYEKWNYCYDVEFNRVDSFGFRCLYLNVLPFYLGGKHFRHETEMDYLCHLQAVVEILDKYNQVRLPPTVPSSMIYFSFLHVLYFNMYTNDFSLILVKIGNILVQIDQTKKRPRAGTSPLVAVPLRLDLSPEEVTKIIGY